METLDLLVYGCVFLIGLIVGRMLMAIQYYAMSGSAAVKKNGPGSS